MHVIDKSPALQPFVDDRLAQPFQLLPSTVRLPIPELEIQGICRLIASKGLDVDPANITRVRAPRSHSARRDACVAIVEVTLVKTHAVRIGI